MKPPEENNTNSSSDSGSPVSTLTKENATESNAIQVPEISLPKGGGALKGIDEKFEVNAANGTAGFSIPLPISPGRNGFSPSLGLSYNSGGGNSPYGLGWDVSIPAIQRKTDKQLPRYMDDKGDGIEEDVFMFSGAEDLVPFLTEATPGDWQTLEYDDGDDGDYRVKRYRPRIEGGFARIERIFHPTHSVYWKVTTPDNTTTIFGRSTNSRIADPENDAHIFKWLPEFSYDDKGNWIQYEYKKEDLDNVPNDLNENNRINGSAKFTNAYLKRIKYGNRVPFYVESPANPYDPPLPASSDHFFELVLDYGEHDDLIPTPDEVPNRLWDYRPDPFSQYRSGFEIRTYRLCRRVLMFHKFEELGITPYLVSTLDLNYESSSKDTPQKSEVTYLKSITQSGYIRKPDSSYSRKSLPPMEFEYEKLEWNREIREVSEESIVNAPVGLTNNYQWLDLYGEGISGIFTEQGTGWYYKSNLGDVGNDGDVRFTRAQQVIPKPSLTGMSTGALQLQDLEANGQKQIVVNSPGLKGFFELTDDNDWLPFKAFEQTVNIDPGDPNVRLIDLDGDGQPELVVSEENAFIWYRANGKKGYEQAARASKPFDEEKGPSIVFADQQQTIFLADMSGDGLTDIARIRNGEICYWPNMGYGRFGVKVAMDNAPLFDSPDLFNPQYLHLADVSGTGATDIFYLGQNRFKAYINLSGNGFSDAQEIEPFFPIDTNSRLSVIDLLGTGTSCIVWSSDLPGYSNAPMRYIDLMGSKKPHVLRKHVNNLGKETTLEYKSSTHFYLTDKLAGKPWITKLPFPVQLVSKSIVEEKITNVRFASEYRYHHGYYDHPEREFRGFGMVEQIDTEHYENWSANNAGNQLEQSEELYQKPVLTRTWYHTGAFLDRVRILTQFTDEYWHEEYNRRFPDVPLTVTEPELIDARLIASENIIDQQIIDRLIGDEWREVLRACKGMVLRQEVFAMDAPESGATDDELQTQLKPYSVATHNCNIQLLQPRDMNQYGVFLVTESEAIAIQYERDETDPRIAHTLNTRFDEYGNILEAASVVYPRLAADASLPAETQLEQIKTVIIYTDNRFTNDVIGDDMHRLRLPSEVITFELKGVSKANDYYTPTDFTDILDDAISDTAFYHELNKPLVAGKAQKRLIEHVRSVYLSDDLTGPLPPGIMESRGIPHESYQLAYTPALLQHIYGNKIPNPAATMGEGRYTNIVDGANWWIRSGTTQFIDTANSEDVNSSKARFYTPISFTDPFGTKTTVKYDTESFNNTIRNNDGYYLTVRETEDALLNRVKVELFDYRTFSPRQMRDINDNLSEVMVDELGLVKAVAMLGKDLDNDGGPELELADNLNDLEAITENEMSNIQAFFQTEYSNVLDQVGRDLLKQATSRFVYDLDTYRNSGSPVVVAAINRETHHGHLETGEETKLQISFEYSDGLGNVAMVKAQAVPGVARQATVQADGTYTISDVDTAAMNPPRLRWVGNGRTVLNNKGNPVKQYEPYFSVTPHYEDARELVETGVTPVIYYDSLGRNIRTELPDNTFTEIEFDAWMQKSFDQNDTVKDSKWYDDRINNLIDVELVKEGKDPAKEKAAAQKTAKHYGTPSVVHLDTLGRPILSIEHNRDLADNDESYNTIIELDIEGNARKVIDARVNTVMEYQYDMLGHRVYQNSMDAGERWMFNNVMGNPVKSWDSRDHVFSFFYDTLQRPTEMNVEGGDGPTPLNNIYEKIIYGEGEADDKLNNLRGQIFEHYDTAGKIEFSQFDLKGNLIKTFRKLAADYKNVVDWNGHDPNAKLEAETFNTESKFDALNRVVWSKAPDNSITEPGYNDAGLLEAVDITQENTLNQFVKNIDYDEKGQRQSILYGNDVKTTYQYDEKTFRLLHLETRRGNGYLLQDLYYTYDPVGNITVIEDRARPTIFFGNQETEPVNSFTYDALYRLIEAKGREHIAQVSFGQQDNWNDLPFLKQYNQNDPMVWRDYTQAYRYDDVGNIEQMKHTASNGSWTRDYDYETNNNRLISTTVGANTYVYPYHPQHGFMTAMPHLPVMEWDFEDQLHVTGKQVVNNGNTAERTYYVYDSSGERIRKVTENQANPGEIPTLKDERIYLGGLEVYRKYNGNGSSVILERETLHIMDYTQRIAMIETKTVDMNNNQSPAKLVRYQFGNHLGSASLELDGLAAVISYEEYHPYGTTAYQAVNKDIKAAAKRYRYTGKERDDETGLYYHGARYYVCWLGRWTSADPIGIGDGINLYAYVLGNPPNLSDPTGRNAQTSGGLTISPNTKISAEKWVEMINNSAKLTPYMKSLFKADGDKIVIVSANRDKVPAGENVPQWFVNAINAIQRGEWHLTTGTSIVNPPPGYISMSERLIPDIDPTDHPVATGFSSKEEAIVGETIPSESMAVMNKSTPFARKMSNEVDGGNRRPYSKSKPNIPAEGLIVVANRFRDTKKAGIPALRHEDAILETFFHELGAHAALESKNIDSQHNPTGDWLNAPVTKSDHLALDVHKFFAVNPIYDKRSMEVAEATGPTWRKKMLLMTKEIPLLAAIGVAVGLYEFFRRNFRVGPR
ncbi:MAG: insecticidal toxin complex protein [Candidatus Brocadiaceae bacterium]|nr:insecticidal toxin complex protein [Candidatus Brocadiaceae bacterium]